MVGPLHVGVMGTRHAITSQHEQDAKTLGHRVNGYIAHHGNGAHHD